MTIPPEVPIQRYLKAMHQEDLSGFWLDALGWIAYYFGQLEGLSYRIIDEFGSARDRKKAKDMPYQERTDLAKSLICKSLTARGDKGLSDEWAELLTAVKAAAPLRNSILHNPLSINFLTTSPFTDPDQGVVLVKKPGKPILKLGAVQSFAQSVVALNQRALDLIQRSGPWRA